MHSPEIVTKIISFASDSNAHSLHRKCPKRDADKELSQGLKDAVPKISLCSAG